MSTKVRSTVKVNRESGETTLTIVLEKPFHAFLNDGDEVFVELSTTQGSRVEFHKIEEVIPSDETTETDEISVGDDPLLVEAINKRTRKSK